MISIALASYNGSKYIREQLDSILAQTYQDFELIICDDCSTDNTWQILEEYAQKDSRIRIFENGKNLGFKKNFEKAISLCSGEYIALSDQDDIWTENHLEVLLNNIDNYSLACGNCLLIDKGGNSMQEKLNENEGFFLFESSKFIYRSLLKGNCLQGANMLLDREFAKKCIPIPRGVLYHDAWFVACACLDKGINYSFDVINKYRQHGGNVTFAAHNKKNKNCLRKLHSMFDLIINGSKTDRFYYIEALKTKFGLENMDFELIYHIIDKIRCHKLLGYRDIKALWRNYYYIVTQKSHKGFLKFLIIRQFFWRSI